MAQEASLGEGTTGKAAGRGRGRASGEGGVSGGKGPSEEVEDGGEVVGRWFGPELSRFVKEQGSNGASDDVGTVRRGCRTRRERRGRRMGLLLVL